MDEPFSALDPISREKLQDDIVSLQKAIKKTIVFVTHDMQEALKLGDKICIMKDGEIVQTGTPEELINNPVNDFVKDFIGRVSYENISFKLEQILSPLTISHFAGTIIPATSSFQETLEALSENDQIGIEKDGAIIGLIDRQSLIQYQLNGMKEGGKE